MKSKLTGSKLTHVARLLRLVPLLAMLQCAGSDDTTGSSDGTMCEQVTARLRSCTLISEQGYTGCMEPQDATEQCQDECLLDASCDDLTTAFCSSSKEPPEGPLAQCYKSCDGTDSFSCTDGSTVPKSFVCDGEADCSSGEDEAGCDFYCPDGDAVPKAYRCDGLNDCADGSDEMDCPSVPLFTCDNGETIPVDLHCDSTPSCSDGSDEQGCAQALCPE